MADARLIPLLAALLLASCAADRHRGAEADPGSVLLPRHEALSLDGATVAFPRPEQVTVVAFISTHCRACDRLAADLDRIWRRAEDDRGLIVGVVIGATREQAVHKRDRQRVAFPWIVDEDGELAESCGVAGFPTAFVLDGDGRVVLTADGSPGDGERIRRALMAFQ